jgi:hypothetical protein
MTDEEQDKRDDEIAYLYEQLGEARDQVKDIEARLRELGAEIYYE